MPSFLPKLPQLIDIVPRPRNARPFQGQQINYTGTLAGPSPEANAVGLPGVVTSDMLHPRQTGVMREPLLAQTAMGQGAQQQSPWFSNPFTQQPQTELPYWMRPKGFGYGSG